MNRELIYLLLLIGSIILNGVFFVALRASQAMIENILDISDFDLPVGDPDFPDSNEKIEEIY